MNLKQLHQFIVLSETLSFTTAAARLSMSQPPLSVSIRLLEDEIGERLFERSTGGVQLTAVGQGLIEHARRTLFHAEQFRQTARMVAGGQVGTLRISFVASSTISLLPKAIAHFRADHPKVDLRLSEAGTNAIMGGLLDGLIDIGLVRSPTPNYPSVATVIVCSGAVWLVRTPPPATEASLPRATSTTLGAGAPPATALLPSTQAVVLVHVAGAVVEPGVYELSGDARVRDAIVAAGGPTETADWNALNLAAVVGDGVKVYVPSVGEVVPPSLIAPASPVSGQPSAPIDVNVATAAELEALPGVGPATAAAIVTERERNGPFVGVDDLDRVSGIGPAKLDALRGLVTT